MQAYTEFIGKIPEELIDKAEQEISDGILPRKRKIKRLTDFRKHLQDNELADKSVQDSMGDVRSFYAAFDIEIPRSSNSERAVTTLKKNVQFRAKSF